MKKIYFRADAGAAIGYGHFIRTLALADMLKADFACTFFTCHPTAYQIGEMEKVCPYVALQEETHFDDFLSRLHGDEIVVLDNYFFTTDYQRAIKDKGCRLVCVDDMHDKHYVADVVINHVLTDVSLFDVELYTRLCLGLKWALLRKPFLMSQFSKEKESGHWLVAFGGTDTYNLTEKYVRILERRKDVNRVSVVVGDAYKCHGFSVGNTGNLMIYKNLSAERMAALMWNCEYAVLPCSGICIEALSQGCKVFAGYFVDNQIGIYNEFSLLGLICPLGNLLTCEEIPVGNSFLNEWSDGFVTVRTNYLKLFHSL